jgi:hypothetical protein
VLDPIEEPDEIVSYAAAGSRADNQHEQVTVVGGGAMMGDELPDGPGQLAGGRFRERECVLCLDSKRRTTHWPHTDVIDNVFSLAIDS